ncbi:hypothetical protein PILCRDRAFT_96366 [Piloderma croceum F 1598]|uniref:Rad21/Rec8-like protein N-terminal domain-containing protein n=1 Tax=Piloderma croceum (strain F 1598) TaxID=765440 RepID=A0A0C3FMA0_PILCF|nr:hypothetical protein PILCRDRAFT_96366 [Piloderma croceum F 1598]
MFFTPELLAKRDSGFGLLWLAATLGSKSTFKRLPKRSVLTADITQLCDLIAEPAEPLALRLSSNLMVGVARYFKQEIFMSDVTICFNSLKKVVQELHSMSATDAQLQMAQPSIRPSALTLVADPRMTFAMDFDNLVAPGGEEDDDFDPKSKKGKGRPKLKAVPLAENLRADLHTLNENHEHLLSASFDVSLNGSGVLPPSSSQFDEGFGYGLADNFFGAPDDLDVGGGIGDELARELGEGWGASPIKGRNDIDIDVDAPADLGMDAAMEFDMDGDFLLENELGRAASETSLVTDLTRKLGKKNKQKIYRLLPLRLHHSLAAFLRQLLALDSEGPLPEDKGPNKRPLKKTKRVRLLLDPRTELTDDELKTARTQYLEGQNILRREIFQKRSEKECGKVVENMLWGVPTGLQAQVLVDFWLENYKVQVEARSGLLHVDVHDEPPKKRRKIRDPDFEDNTGKRTEAGEAPDEWNPDIDMDMDMDMGVGFGGNVDFHNLPLLFQHFCSVAFVQTMTPMEPGQGRLGSSRPPSIQGGNFGIDIGTQNSLGGSQRSTFFPWDHAGDAGASSSVTGIAFDSAGPGGDKVSFDNVEVRMRGSSLSAGSRRASSLLPSRRGSMGGVPASPGTLGEDLQFAGEDFAFDVPANHSAALESQLSDFNLVNLERNSFNFLE